MIPDPRCIWIVDGGFRICMTKTGLSCYTVHTKEIYKKLRRLANDDRKEKIILKDDLMHENIEHNKLRLGMNKPTSSPLMNHNFALDKKSIVASSIWNNHR